MGRELVLVEKYSSLAIAVWLVWKKSILDFRPYVYLPRPRHTHGCSRMHALQWQHNKRNIGILYFFGGREKEREAIEAKKKEAASI